MQAKTAYWKYWKYLSRITDVIMCWYSGHMLVTIKAIPNG